MYKVNPEAFSGVFVMPKKAADDFLILSSEKQLKVLIYMYSHAYEIPTLQEISKATGIDEKELPDIFSYWEDLSMLKKDGDEINLSVSKTNETVSDKKEEAENEQKEKKEKINVKPTPLSHENIRNRIAQSEEVRVLLAEAQQSLGRTIGMGDQSSLILLYDYYGLPIEIILSLCEFARTHNKSRNMNYIYKMGIDWSDREIDTLERADAEFKKIEAVNSNWNDFCRITGIKSNKPTSSQAKYLGIWVDEWQFSMNILSLAFEEMSKYKGDDISFQYMHKILSSWRMKGVKTEADVERIAKEWNEAQEQKNAAKNKKTPAGSTNNKKQEYSTKASYDIDAAVEKAKTSVPVFKMREKR